MADSLQKDADLARAAKKADTVAEAKKLIQHAGNGLADVFKECELNATTLETVAKIQVAQGCLTEAAVLLLEAEMLPKLQLMH